MDFRAATERAGAALELVVYEDGKLLRTRPNHGPVALWPEPPVTGYLEASPTLVAQYDRAA